VRTALEAVKAPVVVIQDGDLEYDPGDFEAMLVPIREGKSEVVYGSRFSPGRRNANPGWHTWGNRILTFISNRATGLRLTDEATCYKMARREVFERLSLRENRFGLCPELTAKIAKLGVRVVEVPISYKGRGRAEGKKIRFRDGLDALRCIIKYSFFD
jgi:hypothetical protein